MMLGCWLRRCYGWLDRRGALAGRRILLTQWMGGW